MLRSPSKTLLLLLVAGALLASVYTHGSGEDAWKCKHGEHGNPEPELIDIEEDYNPGADSGRRLTTYPNIRMYGYYGLLSTASTSMRNYLEYELIPPILNYWSAALTVKYPVSGNLKITSSTVCSVTTPTAFKDGVAADFIYMIATDVSSDYVASSYACNLASGSYRPIVGHTTISTEYLTATTDVMLHERNMICIMHEVVHTLGWSQSLYDYWLVQTGETRLTGHVQSAVLDGYTTIVLVAEPLTTMVRDHFGCSTLKGAYMENTGSSGTAGCHWERRQYAYEAMTSGLIYQMQFSNLTLGLLETTGWYVPNYAYGDLYAWGQSAGCGFLTSTCSSSLTSEYPSEFCTGSTRTCVSTGMGGGYCDTDTRSDNCYWVHPDIYYNCDDTASEAYTRLASLQTYGRNTGSKCFTGTLDTSKAGAASTFCFKYTCSGSGSSTELTLTVGGKSVVCKEKGTVSVSGYAGVIDCPDPLTYCQTTGMKVCPRGCMGKGKCVNGLCECDSGYSGQDCALNSYW